MSASSHTYALILAGGSGTRFWPLSRDHKPKQLLDLFNSGTLLAQTIDRLHGLVPIENILILTNEKQVAAVRELAPRVVHVHLKDILPPEKGPGPTLRAMGHETCALGGGVGAEKVGLMPVMMVVTSSETGTDGSPCDQFTGRTSAMCERGVTIETLLHTLLTRAGR